MARETHKVVSTVEVLGGMNEEDMTTRIESEPLSEREAERLRDDLSNFVGYDPRVVEVDD